MQEPWLPACMAKLYLTLCMTAENGLCQKLLTSQQVRVSGSCFLEGDGHTMVVPVKAVPVADSILDQIELQLLYVA